MVFPTLQSDRLLLRKIIHSDIHNIFKGLSNPLVTLYYGLNYDTLEETQSQMNRYEYLEHSGKGMWWAICLSIDKSFIGAIGFTKLDRDNLNGELGYWLLPEYSGLGFMKEALEMVCGFGFSNLRLHRIQASVESKNANSRKLLISSEFQHEGTLKDCEYRDDEFISYEIFAKFNPENHG